MLILQLGSAFLSSDCGNGDLGFVEAQHLQFGHPFEVNQSRVGAPGVPEGERLQLGPSTFRSHSADRGRAGRRRFQPLRLALRSFQNARFFWVLAGLQWALHQQVRFFRVLEGALLCRPVSGLCRDRPSPIVMGK